MMLRQVGLTADDSGGIILVQNWHEELKRLVPVG